MTRKPGPGSATTYFGVLPRSSSQRRDVMRSAALPLAALLALWFLSMVLLGGDIVMSTPLNAATATTSGVVEDDCPDPGSACHVLHWKDALERDHATPVTFRSFGQDVEGLHLQLAYDPADPDWSVVVLDDRAQAPASGVSGALLLVGVLALVATPVVLALRTRRRMQEGPMFQAQVTRWHREVLRTGEEGGKGVMHTQECWTVTGQEPPPVHDYPDWTPDEPDIGTAILTPDRRSVFRILLGGRLLRPGPHITEGPTSEVDARRHNSRPRVGGAPVIRIAKNAWFAGWAVVALFLLVVVVGSLSVGVRIASSSVGVSLSVEVVAFVAYFVAGLTVILLWANRHRRLITMPVPEPMTLPNLDWVSLRRSSGAHDH